MNFLKKSNTNTNKAFTLIELLVVISIIGLLSSIVLASLNTARAKARDAKRVSELKQLQTALELYRSDNSDYPLATRNGSSRESSCGNHGSDVSVMVTKWDSSLDVLVSGGYLPSLPEDPIDTISGYPDYCYGYLSTNSTSPGSPYDDCIDITSSSIANIEDYEYIIYYSTEDVPTSGYKPYWNGSTASMNRCLLGPHK